MISVLFFYTACLFTLTAAAIILRRKIFQFSESADEMADSPLDLHPNAEIQSLKERLKTLEMLMSQSRPELDSDNSTDVKMAPPQKRKSEFS